MVLLFEDAEVLHRVEIEGGRAIAAGAGRPNRVGSGISYPKGTPSHWQS